MRDLTFRTYLEASESESPEEFYKDFFGDEYNLILSYHLKTKEYDNIKNHFKVVENIEDMTWGQFIASEIALSDSKDQIKIFSSITSIIIRPLDEIEYDNSDEYAEKELKNIILDSDARMIVEYIKTFKKLRDDFIRNKYRGVFYMVSRDNEELKEEDVSGKDTIMDEFVKQWYWYAITHELAEENLVIKQDKEYSKFENALNTKMSHVAPEVAYKRHKQIINEMKQYKADNDEK